MKLTILGCGSSAGVPTIQNHWGKCDPQNPRNKRTRTSLSIEYKGELWLIDVGPDIKTQVLREGIKRVDGVFITHNHADHILGLDELRPFVKEREQKIPLYGDAVTVSRLQIMFPHLFDVLDAPLPLGKNFFSFSPRLIAPSFAWKDVTIGTFMQPHGPIHSVCYRFGNWAYSTDVAFLTDAQLDALKGIDLWIVQALSDTKKSDAHSYLEQTLGWIKIVQPKRAVLTHMGLSLDYQALKDTLPPGVEPAYDGMVLETTTFS